MKAAEEADHLLKTFRKQISQDVLHRLKVFKRKVGPGLGFRGSEVFKRKVGPGLG